jgi:hypothetical protein
MMKEYESEEEALNAASSLLGITQEEIKSIKPRLILYENLEGKPQRLMVYELDENLSFGIGWKRFYRGKNLYGLWLIEKERKSIFGLLVEREKLVRV